MRHAPIPYPDKEKWGAARRLPDCRVERIHATRRPDALKGRTGRPERLVFIPLVSKINFEFRILISTAFRMEPSTSLCHKCQLISSEFILSRDFRDFKFFSSARTTATSWTCRRNEQGKRYREIIYHDIGGLQEASQKGCKICSYFLGLLGRFSVNGHFPGLQGQLRVAVSETGSLELVSPSEWTWGDFNLGWQEVLPSNVNQAITARDGQMRAIAGTRACYLELPSRS